MAFTGQAISQLKQVQQSFGYRIVAFFLSSMTMTSPGQIISHIPHPTQAIGSILRIILLFPFVAFAIKTSAARKKAGA
jgi:uncharacterized membrane protein YjjB (DUF3815 family)